MIIKYDNKAIKYTNKWISIGGVTPPPVPTVYSVHTVSSTGGSVSAVPNSGISGTEVTLSNTPATNYTFSSYSVTGATLKNSNQFDIGNSDIYVKGNFTYSDPYNPLGLPPFTMRVKFTDGYTPTDTELNTWTQVSSSPNIWDLTRENPDWYSYGAGPFLYNQDLLEVLGANTSGVTCMDYLFYNCYGLRNVSLFDTSGIIPIYYNGPMGPMWYGAYSMFYRCTSLTSVPLFDFSTLKSTENMFYNCFALTNIPLFDLSNAITTYRMFYACTNVESGALALYQQVSTQANPPSSHDIMFYQCGQDTVTGAAELAQIPTSWGGTMQ